MRNEFAESRYKQLCNTPGDISENLPVLRRYASECDHITEMGVRGIVSTWALIVANPKKMISYDINNPSEYGADINVVYHNCGDTNFRFIEANTIDIEIEGTDLLFLDTLHVYKQLKKELELHSPMTRKYIIMHDTESFGYVGRDGGRGLRDAITEFLENDKSWVLHEDLLNNNGLTILKRIV